MDQKSHTVNLTLLGGVHEVGGNTILLEDKGYNTKILIDFGVKIGRYYDRYESGEHPSSIKELIQANLLPDTDKIPIQNLYLTDLDPKTPNSANPSNLDGILISHPHKDHYLGLSFINRTIPVYTGKVTKRIIRAACKSSEEVTDNNFHNLNWHTFRTGEIVDIKGLKIVPFHVDHSVPAAYGFIIYTSIGSIVYTGDFRRHGTLSYMTEEFLKEIEEHNTLATKCELSQNQKDLLTEGTKVLICEGTKINKGMVESEESVEENLKKIFDNNPFDFILVKYDRIDWDRFRTFSNIAKCYGWKYIITEMDAYFYYLLNRKAVYPSMREPNIIRDDHIYILKRGSIRHKWQEIIRYNIDVTGKADRFLNYRDLKRLGDKFMVYITHLPEILMNNLDFSKRGLFISSSIDPYAEEFYDNTHSIRRQLEAYGIPAYRVHASGHATPQDIINFIEQVRPKYLIPIHTEHPEFFRKLFQGSGIEVILKNRHSQITLN
ncbi:MAG: MBL fold metallo-hydrolase [Candidatus Thorarchaeota archaeon]